MKSSCNRCQTKLTFSFFYLFRRKERSNRARDQILSTKCKGCPTLSGDGLKHLYSDIRLYWQAGTKVLSFHWSQEVVSACVFVKGKNELHTTLGLTDKATAAATWTNFPSSTCLKWNRPTGLLHTGGYWRTCILSHICLMHFFSHIWAIFIHVSFYTCVIIENMNII